MNKEQVIGEAKALLADFREISYTRYAQNLETLREPLLSLRIQAYKDLCRKRAQYLEPNFKDKDRKMTDLDRKTNLEHYCADETAEYELLSGLEKLVAERVELTKIFLEKK